MRPKISLITVFWGDWHTDAFLRFCVPSLLGAYNLPAMILGCDVRMVIATNTSNIPRARAGDQFKALSALIPVEFLDIDDATVPPPSVNRDSGKALGEFLVDQQRRIVNRGFEDGYGLSWIHADCIYANPTFATVAKHAIAGQDIVYLPAFRVSFEDFASSEFGKNYTPCETKDDPLVREAFSCLHEHHRYQFWDADPPTRCPSMRFWHESPGLVVARDFCEKTPLYVSNALRDVPVTHGTDHFDADIFKRSAELRGSNARVSYIADTRGGFVGSFAERDSGPHRLWRLYGTCDDSVTKNSPPPPPSRAESYLAGFKMHFHEPMRKFGAGHLIKIRLEDRARLGVIRRIYHAAHFRIYEIRSMRQEGAKCKGR